MKPQQKHRPKIVIIGGGFAGLTTALKLKGAPIDVTLIDRTNHHLFQPLLYQVAMGALAPGDIATPFRNLITEHCNVSKILEDVVAIDRAAKTITLSDGDELPYDKLVVAVGNQPTYFGHPEWEQYAPGLKSLVDSVNIREQLYTNFETASRIQDPQKRAGLLTTVVVGGGPTGVELAGAIAEIINQTITKDFRNIKRSELRVILIEGADRILATYKPELSEHAKKDLESLGVEVLLQTRVSHIDADVVKAGETTIVSKLKIWAAGNTAPALLGTLGTEQDRMGRILVTPQLHLPTDPDVFVLGDAGNCTGTDGKPMPGVAQVAMQQGKYLAKYFRSGKNIKDIQPFSYFDKGSMATIGRAKAVVQLPNGRAMTGYIAWVAWAAVHVLYLVAGRNRLRVFVEWTLYYLSYRPGVRLIYGAKGKQSPFGPQQTQAGSLVQVATSAV
jgi:NADH:ubiquinone reductase (H+-translocating)